MSVARALGDLSNPVPTQWAITVIVIVLILYPAVAQTISSCADAAALVATLAGAGTAAKYRNTNG
ncbi:hypothetical protein [Streptomyces melanogenes]|uniref:hypothetical protein n=1 Tax=Streptomyces melanogenes TaxID=67326 RepID=UPI003794D5AB